MSASLLDDGRAELVKSPFVVSWFSRARSGDLTDPDPARRASAYAAWAVEALAVCSNGRRNYPALRLDGDFYDPAGTGPRVKPHLEIPQRLLRSPCPDFPDRLAQAGNAMRFPYFLYGEVTALRRALLNVELADVGEFNDALNLRRISLVNALTVLNRTLGQLWPEAAALILSSPDGLSGPATDDFGPDDIEELSPALAEFDLSINFDPKLRAENGSWSSRRLGVWQLRGTTPGGDEFSLGVITPRLTANSLFNDVMFLPERESPAALLVRTLVLKRLAAALTISVNLSADVLATPASPPRRRQAFLRAMPARPGAQVPEASLKAAAAFLEAFPDGDAAYRALVSWADGRYLLTVSQAGFSDSHGRASRALRRAEDIDRRDIDVLLPLCWDVRDSRRQIVRATFSSSDG